MILLIDIGNTRIKWARLDQRGMSVQSAAAHTDWGHDDIRAHVLRDGERPERVLVSNVGGAEIGEKVGAVITDAYGVLPEFLHSTERAGGVRNAYREPAKLGVDRWMCIIGAHAMHARLLCIAGIGTAMTIDAVDAGGQHLGGTIVPGPDLMIASLLRNTSDIATRARAGEVSARVFADNTLGGITQGAMHALAALIDRSAATLQQQFGQQPTLLLTGGASTRVAPFIGSEFESVPDLVLRGLAVIAADSPA